MVDIDMWHFSNRLLHFICEYVCLM